MVHAQCTPEHFDLQDSPGLAEIAAVLNAIDASALIARLDAYRFVGTRYRGRRGYSNAALWRAYVAIV